MSDGFSKKASSAPAVLQLQPSIDLFISKLVMIDKQYVMHDC